MINRIKTSAAGIAVLSLTACAPMISGVMNAATTDQDVIEKTAKYFNAPGQDIKITGIEKKALSTDYKVNYRGKNYNCFVYYGDVTCKQPGS
jgi:ABC-type glycerol-3-phosphate transport system substrate-binding protein